MKHIIFVLIFINFCRLYCQEIPTPPPPSKNNSNKELLNKSKGNFEINEVTSTKTTNEKNESCNIDVFKIDSKHFTENESQYFHKTIESKLNNLDLNISPEEIIAFTKYRNSLNTNPIIIDSIATLIYKFNENSQFEEAIKKAEKLKEISPNNITLFKELSYAYKKLNNKDLAEKNFEMMKKVINAVEKYSDGCRLSPYILNNYFEGLSFYEARLECLPQKTRFILTESKNIICGYDCYHIMRFADLNHYKHYLKEGTYKIE